jgi:hypothetical protein
MCVRFGVVRCPRHMSGSRNWLASRTLICARTRPCPAVLAAKKSIPRNISQNAAARSPRDATNLEGHRCRK